MSQKVKKVSEIGMEGRRPVTNAAPDRPYMRTRARDVVFYIVRTRARDGVEPLLLERRKLAVYLFISESTPQHSEQVKISYLSPPTKTKSKPPKMKMMMGMTYVTHHMMDV